MGSTRQHLHSHSMGAGFTLIELMVVMLMITILLAVAIPRFEGSLLQDSAKLVTRRIIHTVRALRNRAVQQQKLQSLVIDLDDQRFWATSASMDEQAAASAAEKAFKLPESIRFMEVQFPHRDPINSGKAKILFYPAGYSDHAVIHVQNDDQERRSYMVEPLLPKVKLMEEWVDF